MPRSHLSGLLSKLVLAGGLVSAAFARASDQGPADASLDSILGRVRSASLDAAAAVRCKDRTLDLGEARLVIEDATLVPSTLRFAGRVEAVLVGRARFVLETSDPVEAQQIELFTHARKLDEPLIEAVLVLAREGQLDSLLTSSSGEKPDRSTVDRARAVFASWRESSEWRGLRVEQSLVGLGLGDSVAAEAVTIWCRSARLAGFFYRVRPELTRPTVAGRFVPHPLGAAEKEEIDADIRDRQKRGRSLASRVEDIGDWDTWYVRRGADASTEAFDVERTTIDGTISTDPPRFRGNATFALRCRLDGARVVRASLFPDLEVAAVRDAAGGNLAWLRDAGSFVIVLPKAVAAGEAISLQVEWGGVLLNQPAVGVYLLRTSSQWFPRIAGQARSTYDVTLRCPKRLTVLASGREVEHGVRDELRVVRNVLEMPAVFFRFEVGDFDVIREEMGGIPVTLAFLKRPLAGPKEIREDVRLTVRRALESHVSSFGAFPYPSLTVVASPERVSVATPGLVTLANDLVLDLPGIDRRRVTEARRNTIAHELAHQWWGNSIGWAGDGDYWLSEAIAEYAAQAFVKGSNIGEPYAAALADERRDHLARLAANGAPLRSIGPVTLGSRLDSSLTSRGVNAIVYDKGAMVFGMLAVEVGRERFPGSLRQVADALAGRDTDTAGFLDTLGKVAGKDLSRFARQFVYGTGSPDVFYSYASEPKDAHGFRVSGTARMLPSGTATSAVVRAGAGWSVTKSFRPDMSVDEWSLLVPFQAPTVELVSPVELLRQAAPTPRLRSSFSLAVPAPVSKDIPLGSGFAGEVHVRGKSSKFRVAFAEEPKAFRLDEGAEVPAQFYSLTERPKSALESLGMALLRSGASEEAEASLRKALESPLYARLNDEERATKEVKLAEKLEDAWIRVALAEASLDRGDIETAERELDTVDALLSGLDRGRYANVRLMQRVRIEVARGEFDKAFGEMKGKVYLSLLQREGDSTALQLQRRQFLDGFVPEGWGYALLAVSAHETGHEDVCARAREEAVLRGADVSVLDAAHPAR